MLLVAALTVIGALETVNMLNNINVKPNKGLTLLGPLVLLAAAYLQNWGLVIALFTLLLVLHLLMLVGRFPKFTVLDGAAGLFITLYISLLIYIYLISTLPEGRKWLFLMLLGTWASDTFAYFAGRAFGKHKLTPVLSPKKTWEGAVGGVLGTIVTVYVYCLLVMPVSFGLILLMGLGISIAGQLGDLIESAFKRLCATKDSGNLIPGHGGVMDRFDSMMLTAPLVYYFATVFII